jgi:hypothetical protein
MGYRFYISSSDIISIDELKGITNTFEEGVAVDTYSKSRYSA